MPESSRQRRGCGRTFAWESPPYESCEAMGCPYLISAGDLVFCSRARELSVRALENRGCSGPSMPLPVGSPVPAIDRCEFTSTPAFLLSVTHHAMASSSIRSIQCSMVGVTVAERSSRHGRSWSCSGMAWQAKRWGGRGQGGFVEVIGRTNAFGFSPTI